MSREHAEPVFLRVTSEINEDVDLVGSYEFRKIAVGKVRDISQYARAGRNSPYWIVLNRISRIAVNIEARSIVLR
jgi:hypothetical protein